MKLKKSTQPNKSDLKISDLQVGDCFVWSDNLKRSTGANNDWNTLVIYMRVWQPRECPDKKGGWIKFTGFHDSDKPLGKRDQYSVVNKTGQTWNFNDSQCVRGKYPIRVELEVSWCRA